MIVTILSFLGILTMIPTVIVLLVTICFGLYGLVKKDFSHFKKSLKIFGILVAILFVILVIYFIVSFIQAPVA